MASEKNLPKVTVCIPAYNAEKFIGETVRSLVRQDYPNYEIIVIDNSSTDSTGEIVQKVKGETRAENLSCVRFEEFLPSCENWGRAFDLATGDYVTICHADDAYEPNAISTEAEFLSSNPECVAVFSSATTISGTGKKLGEINRPGEFSSGKVDARSLLKFCAKNGYFPLICPSFMVRTNTAKKCGKFNCSFIFAFDMDYYMRLFEFGSIGFLGERLTRYRQHPLQGVARLNDATDTQKEFFDILEREMEKYAVKLSAQDQRKLAAYRRWGRTIDALTHIRAGNEGRARSLARESFRLADALFDFPSKKFLSRFSFSLVFLVSQYLFLGKAFASLVFRYRIMKRNR
jgi:glycosyltransferase involved in cell wall biosynthesis